MPWAVVVAVEVLMIVRMIWVLEELSADRRESPLSRTCCVEMGVVLSGDANALEAVLHSKDRQWTSKVGASFPAEVVMYIGLGLPACSPANRSSSLTLSLSEVAVSRDQSFAYMLFLDCHRPLPAANNTHAGHQMCPHCSFPAKLGHL